MQGYYSWEMDIQPAAAGALLPEHDWLDPLAALPVGQPLAVRPRVPAHEGLAELVAVVRGAVGSIDQDLRGDRGSKDTV